MSVTSTLFGRTQNGEDVYSYTLENSNGMRVCVIEYGCAVTNIFVKNKKGEFSDVVLGYDNLEAYENASGCLGKFVGRYANRIENSTFTIGDTTYNLTPNNGKNHLHGVLMSKVFKGSVEDDKLVLTYKSPDGEEGFPGNLDVTVTYSLTDTNAIVMDYTATTDEPTIVNFTNHSYFNLDGVGSQSVLKQTLQIEAEAYCEGNAETCPTGNILPVKGTAFDFSTPKAIGRDMNMDDPQIKMANGYDHNFILDKGINGLALAATARSAKMGITMETYTTQPGVQLYTGNFLAGSEYAGKDGKPHVNYQGFCLETQHYPCTPSHPEFPSVLLMPDEEYHETTGYKFITDGE